LTSQYYRNRYRIDSTRLRNWNYNWNGQYFLTIVTQHRECNLGKIRNEEIILSDFGKIVDKEWLESFEIRKELFLDEYIIMPNHLHAIVILRNSKSKYNKKDINEQLTREAESISSFIGGFKASVTTEIDNYIDNNALKISKYNRHNHFFLPRFYDRIIRNRKSYWAAKKYIRNNPKNWSNDIFNK
jgi:REP element-mobilizing transposase RayT